MTTTNLTPAEDLDVVVGSVAAYTDHVAAYTTFNADAVAETAEVFIASLAPGARVLDAGCGPGRDLARFTAAGLDPVGIDLNPAFVTEASAHAPVMLGDLRDLPFDDASFDGVWACASLVHLPHLDATAALAELARVTRAGGTVYVSVKHAGQTGWTETAHGRRWFQIWDPEEFAASVAGTGLKVTRVVEGPVFVDVWATA